MTSPHDRARLRRPLVAIACGIVGVMVASSCAGSDTPELDPVVASEVLAANLGRPRDVSERSNDPDQPGDVDSVEVTNPADSSGGTGADESGGGLSTGAIAVPVIKSADAPRVPGIDPFSHPTMPQEELERFIAAVETLDRDATCPPTVVPASLDGHAEVLRIADGCMHIEYHPFEGRTIWQARYEIMQADPTVFAVGFPSDDLEPDQAADLDSDEWYNNYDQWHLEYLDVRELQAGWPNDQDDEIVVAVIDSGVDDDHPLLTNRIHRSEELRQRGDTCHTNPHRTFKTERLGVLHDHGTHVAGIIAANPFDNSRNSNVAPDGIIGVAPGAQILPIKVHFGYDYDPALDANGDVRIDSRNFIVVDTTSPADPICDSHVGTLSDALDIAFESGANIVNMSLTWSLEPLEEHLEDGLKWCTSINQELGYEACEYERHFTTLIDGGSLLDRVAAQFILSSLVGPHPAELVIQALTVHDTVVISTAGNDGLPTEISFRMSQLPASYEHVIAVAAIDDESARAVRSWWGSDAHEDVDIAAPGSCILSTINPPDDMTGDFRCDHTDNATPNRRETITPTSGAGFKSGTSMAAPVIAGVVAHMQARFPSASVRRITEALYSTAQIPEVVPNNCDSPLIDDDCFGHGIVQPLAAIDHLAALNPGIAYVTDETGSLQIALTDRDGEKRIVTDSSGGNYGPSLSPDGSRIVFARNEGSGNDLWVANVDGSEEPRTDSRQSEYAPSWSPDGSQIVFIRDKSTSDTKRCGFLWLSSCKEYVRRPSEIVVMNSDGSDEKQLFSGENIFTPQWTPDGKEILFDYNGDIASLDLASRNVRIVLDDGHNYCPSPSPDSEMIAYSSDRTGNEDIYIMGADGGKPRRVIDHAANDRCPVWMPDGESLVFTSDRDGDDEIYIVEIDGTRIDGTNPRQLTDNDHRDFQPSVTKSGEAAAVIASTDLTVQRIDPLPAAVDDAGGEFDALDSSWDHVCSSLQNKAALCWGTTASGPESASPEARTSASAGGSHSCALDAGGAVVCWGSGFLGQTDAPEGTFRAVAAGWDHTCGLNSSGGIECWGSDQHGQASPPSGRFTAITAGDGHSCALDGNGAITCWGLNEDGQASPPSGRFTVIEAGSAHSCALDEAGRITCWGANWFGQTDPPVGSFVGVAAGYGHTCALDLDGFATCWGLNNDYQANAPYRVFTTITAGRAHTCGLDIHAEVMCWGTLEPDET